MTSRMTSAQQHPHRLQKSDQDRSRTAHEVSGRQHGKKDRDRVEYSARRHRRSQIYDVFDAVRTRLLHVRRDVEMALAVIRKGESVQINLGVHRRFDKYNGFLIARFAKRAPCHSHVAFSRRSLFVRRRTDGRMLRERCATCKSLAPSTLSYIVEISVYYSAFYDFLTQAGAQPWVGRARWSFGSFYLWGDVPALMPPIVKAHKVPGFQFDGSGGSFQSASVALTGVKAPGMNWSDQTKRGQDFTRIAGDHAIKNQGGSWFAVSHNKVPHTRGDAGDEHIKLGGSWFHGYRQGQGPRNHGSKSQKRKFASAMIAKIPLPLSRHIAATFKPSVLEIAA
jgi:hypothetical protein